MKSLVVCLCILVPLSGCRTPAYLGGEFRHRDPTLVASGPVETFAERSRWVFFWGLLGTEDIDLPEVGGGFDLQEDVARRYTGDEKIVDLTVEQGNTIPGIITSFFTLGIVNQREVVVRGRRVRATPTE